MFSYYEKTKAGRYIFRQYRTFSGQEKYVSGIPFNLDFPLDKVYLNSSSSMGQYGSVAGLNKGKLKILKETYGITTLRGLLTVYDKSNESRRVDIRNFLSKGFCYLAQGLIKSFLEETKRINSNLYDPLHVGKTQTEALKEVNKKISLSSTKVITLRDLPSEIELDNIPKDKLNKFTDSLMKEIENTSSEKLIEFLIKDYGEDQKKIQKTIAGYKKSLTALKAKKT